MTELEHLKQYAIDKLDDLEHRLLDMMLSIKQIKKNIENIKSKGEKNV